MMEYRQAKIVAMLKSLLKEDTSVSCDFTCRSYSSVREMFVCIQETVEGQTDKRCTGKSFKCEIRDEDIVVETLRQVCRDEVEKLQGKLNEVERSNALFAARVAELEDERDKREQSLTSST